MKSSSTVEDAAGARETGRRGSAAGRCNRRRRQTGTLDFVSVPAAFQTFVPWRARESWAPPARQRLGQRAAGGGAGGRRRCVPSVGGRAAPLLSRLHWEMSAPNASAGKAEQSAGALSTPARRPLGHVWVTGGDTALAVELARALSRMTDAVAKPDSVAVVYSAEEAARPLHSLPGVVAMRGDLRSPEWVRQAFARRPPQTIFSVSDDSFRDECMTTYADSVNLIEEAVKDVRAADGDVSRRFILVSLVGCGSSEQVLPWPVREPLMPFLEELTLAETCVERSGLPYTIVRSGVLEEGEADGEPITTADTTGYGCITRKDMANLLIDVARSERALGKTLTALDMTRLLYTRPYVRPMEAWETPAFDLFTL